MEKTEEQKCTAVNEEIDFLFKKNLPDGISKEEEEKLKIEFEEVRPKLFKFLYALLDAKSKKKKSSN